MFAVFVISFLFSVNLHKIDGYKNKSVAHRLYRNLMIDQEYNKNVRPVVNSSEPTTVNISLYLLNIVEFNEVTEKLSITAKLKICWIDEYLSWDPLQYDGLKSINLPQDEIWKPDIALENSITKYRDLGTTSIYISIHSDGHVLWKPMEVFHSTCSADVTKYPMDIQNCCLSFESWTHSRRAVQIRNGSKNVHLHHGYDGQPQWLITDTKSEATYESGDYYVTFCITLKRQSMYVMLNIILPIVMLSLLSTCVFVLPASSGEKASFSVTVFLSVGVFLTIVSAQLPKASDNVSMFNVYVFTQVLISTLATIITLIQIRLYHRDDTCRVPGCIQTLTFCCMSRREKQVYAESNGEVQTKTSGDQKNSMALDTADGFKSNDGGAQVTWRLVANLMDPLMFKLFISLNITLSLSLMAWSMLK